MKIVKELGTLDEFIERVKKEEDQLDKERRERMRSIGLYLVKFYGHHEDIDCSEVIGIFETSNQAITFARGYQLDDEDKEYITEEGIGVYKITLNTVIDLDEEVYFENREEKEND